MGITEANVAAMPNIHTWLRGDSSSTTTVGAGISQLTDRSGGFNAVQATASKQPLYTTTPQPGATWANTKIMTSGASSSQLAETLFVVARPTVTAGYLAMRGCSGTGSSGANAFMLINGKQVISRQGVADTLSGTVGYTANTISVFTMDYVPGSVHLFQNGTNNGTSTSNVQPTAGRTTQIGAGYNGGDNFVGDIYEVLSFSRVLTDTERAQVHSYLSDRYTVTVSDYIVSDFDAPTVPQIGTAVASGPTKVTVTWSASTDATGVSSYRVMRNSVALAGATALTTTSFIDNTVVAGTSYLYTVSAIDAAGNRSAESSVASVTTPYNPDTKIRINNTWMEVATRARVAGVWALGASKIFLPTVEVPPSIVSYIEAMGTLTARPTWTNPTAAAGPLNQPTFSPTRTLTLPNMPADGGNISAAWMAYFGNRVGVIGTKQAGDRVIIPAGIYYYSDNLDIPDHNNNIELVLGDASGRATLRSAHLNAGLVNSHAVRVLGADNIKIRGHSATNYGTIETQFVAGRTGLNQQGNTMLLLDPGTIGFRGQDLILRGARGAGFFAYSATDYWLNRVTTEDSLADGFHNTQGSSYGLYTDCVSNRNGDDGIAFVYYDGNAIDGQSHHMEVYRHQVFNNGHGRGFAVICCSDIYAEQVNIEGTAAASVIIDREASSSGVHGNISNVLLQRFLIKGGNWSEQDHGSLFLRNGLTNGTVTGVVCESFEFRDAAPNRQVIRTIGDGTANTILECTLKDFKFSGGTTVVANDQFGGNATSRITRSGFFNADTVAGQDLITPTVVINTPGRYAVVSGVMTGATTDTSAMRNTQAIQFYAGDTGAKISGANVTGVASVEIKVGDTVIGTVLPAALDAAKRGSQVWDTTTFQNGPARISIKATDKNGLTKTVTRDVVVNNATPGSTPGMPA